MSWSFYVPDNEVSDWVTALPSSPYDGQIITFTDSLTAPTYAWQLRYVAAKSTNKWVFIGGSPKVHEVATSQTTTSVVAADLATDGPTMTWPLAGDYEVQWGGFSFVNTGFNGNRWHLFVNGAEVSAPRAFVGGATDGGDQIHVRRRVSGAVAGQTVKVRYSVDSDTGTFLDRFLLITPVAVGG